MLLIGKTPVDVPPEGDAIVAANSGNVQFLFDLYDGPGVGSQSVKTVITNQIKDANHKKILMANLRKQIGMFFNYKQIDKIHSINTGSLDWLWNISESKILMGTVKKPNDYFKLKLFNNLMVLPDNCRVVKIFK